MKDRLLSRLPRYCLVGFAICLTLGTQGCLGPKYNPPPKQVYFQRSGFAGCRNVSLAVGCAPVTTRYARDESALSDRTTTTMFLCGPLLGMGLVSASQSAADNDLDRDIRPGFALDVLRKAMAVGFMERLKAADFISNVVCTNPVLVAGQQVAKSIDATIDISVDRLVLRRFGERRAQMSVDMHARMQRCADGAILWDRYETALSAPPVALDEVKLKGAELYVEMLTDMVHRLADEIVYAK